VQHVAESHLPSAHTVLAGFAEYPASQVKPAHVGAGVVVGARVVGAGVVVTVVCGANVLQGGGISLQHVAWSQ